MSCRIISPLLIAALCAAGALADYAPWDNTMATTDSVGVSVTNAPPYYNRPHFDPKAFTTSSPSFPTTYGSTALWVIRLFQIVISHQDGSRCRYYPTCSAYALQAIRKYGMVTGTLMAYDRWLRCNQFGSYGYDPVEDHYFGRKRRCDAR